MLFQQRSQDSGNVIFEDEVFLVRAFEQLAAQAVDRLALLVHHVVVFEQMFAGFEVLAFNLLLRLLDAPADHARFNRNAFFHPQPLEQS